MFKCKVQHVFGTGANRQLWQAVAKKAILQRLPLCILIKFCHLWWDFLQSLTCLWERVKITQYYECLHHWEINRCYPTPPLVTLFLLKRKKTLTTNFKLLRFYNVDNTMTQYSPWTVNYAILCWFYCLFAALDLTKSWRLILLFCP